MFKREGVYIEIRNGHGEEIEPGTQVVSFRGELGTFEGVGRLSRVGGSKVVVNGRETNPSVWGLTSTEVGVYD